MFTDNKTLLVDLELDRVDLVKEGANTKAHIKLLKRKETQPMTFEEIMKTLKEEHAEVVTKALEEARKARETELTTAQADLAKAKEDLTKANESLATTKADLEKSKEQIAKAKPQEDDIEVLMKSVNPALAKHIQDLQATVSTLVTEKSDQVAKERFETVKAIPVEEAKLKEVIKAVSPAAFEVLQAAAQAIEKNLLTAKGANTHNETGSDTEIAFSKLDKSAKKIQGENAGMTYEAAFTKACELDPETYNKSR